MNTLLHIPMAGMINKSLTGNRSAGFAKFDAGTHITLLNHGLLS